jgi:hypothetical protein
VDASVEKSGEKKAVKKPNDEQVTVVLFFIGTGNPNARIGSVTYDKKEAAALGCTVQHGEFWLALLSEKPSHGERKLLRLRGPLEADDRTGIFGPTGDPEGDLRDWAFQAALNLVDRGFAV